jgi:hypothetical protein
VSITSILHRIEEDLREEWVEDFFSWLEEQRAVWDEYTVRPVARSGR